MRTILVIEDDRIVRENIAEMLELSGYKADMASNGREGVEKAIRSLPDLIICDIKMPEFDGFGVLHVLRKNPDTAGTPFIFLTAKTERRDRRKGMEMGADDFITKPFEDTELLHAVEARLTRDKTLADRPDQQQLDNKTFLEQADLLAHFENLTSDLETFEFGKREIIFRAGDYPHYLYLIKKGRVKTSRMNADGKEFISNIYEAGDLFGFQAIFENRAYNETAEAMNHSAIKRIPKEEFVSELYKNRELASQVIRMMSEYLSVKDDQIAHFAYDSVRKRLAIKLLELMPDETASSIDISRTNLAALLGTTPETIVRTLTELKNLKVIDTEGQFITLRNRKKLRSLQKNW